MAWKLRCIFTGRLKEPFARDWFEHYRGRLAPHVQFTETVLRDADGRLPPERRREAEGKAILEALGPGDLPVVLDERGRDCTSRQFADRLRGWFEDPGRTPCFVIGGPYGFGDEVRRRAAMLLRLGSMTWPHELARVMLMEQLYRAVSILKGSPYHHD
ncbi:MAG: 23S rRNA (pseudouridine(1915)-N(3))-methyltransferase RlmH [Desulfovibrionaceae bacterium]